MKKLHRRILNRLLAKLAGTLPGATTVRPWLHGLRGVQIRGRVFIGDNVYMENEYPESIVLEDGAQIGLRTTIIAHTRGVGRVIFEKNSFVGAGCIIAASDGQTLRIGEGSVLGAGSIVTSDVPAQTLVAPERAKPSAQVTVPFKMETGFDEFRRGLRPLNATPRKP
jgi:acetyltransferase-like isoleucine patch superfamily enzyme